jgi:quercetin dioxygenase-like cupin family protein
MQAKTGLSQSTANARTAGKTQVQNSSQKRRVHMRASKTVLGSVPLLAFALLIGTPYLSAQDMVKVAAKNCKVLLENDHVRVVRVVLKPGEKLAMHSHGANILYSLTGGKAKYTSPDGTTKERESKAGETVWSDAVTHSTENIGTTETHVLVIELKK